jgi:hypothetical protein
MAIPACLLLSSCDDNRHSRNDVDRPIRAQSQADIAQNLCARNSRRSGTWDRSDYHKCLAAKANEHVPADAALCSVAKGDMIDGRCVLLIL